MGQRVSWTGVYKKMKKPNNKSVKGRRNNSRRYFLAVALVGSVVAWLIPVFISFFMVDPQTHAFLPNIYIFKTVMVVSSAAVSYCFYAYLSSRRGLSILVPVIFLVVRAIIDNVMLALGQVMTVGRWAFTILPFYLLVFFGLYIWFGRRSRR